MLIYNGYFKSVEKVKNKLLQSEVFNFFWFYNFWFSSIKLFSIIIDKRDLKVNNYCFIIRDGEISITVIFLFWDFSKLIIDSDRNE